MKQKGHGELFLNEVLKTNTSEEEYIKITYHENEILYVPIRQAYLVSKFQTTQTQGISLDSLSSNKWKIKKEKDSDKNSKEEVSTNDVEQENLDALIDESAEEDEDAAEAEDQNSEEENKED